MLAGLGGFLGSALIAIVPGFSQAMSAPQAAELPVTVSLVLPPMARSEHDASAGGWKFVHVEKGQTLSHVFNDLGIPLSVMRQMLKSPEARTSLWNIGPGKELAFELDRNDQLKTLRFDRNDAERIEIRVGKDGQVEQKIIARPLEQNVAVASGRITRSFAADARRAGLTTSSINKLANVFKYDVDFVEDLRDGDTFEVVYEDQWREGQRLKNGDVLAARITTHNKVYTAFYFEHDGKAEYFDGKGNPLKKVLMRIPIEYARLSSTFGMRNHPVLGRMRMHKGVDYAASTGTPIMAAGDGKVQFVGWKNGYGRAVVLDHGNGRTTLYGHMSAWGKIKQGQRVNQGSTIGYVGMSGLATGPHLHYEFRVNGNQVNPLNVTMPKPAPLSGTEMARFQATIAPALARMEVMQKTTRLAVR
ncbi:M23 family metallopeptidase [Arenimonas oryziterrae]|uniref:Peptidase M23 n=1 Tax=Arenimonas oryziterrae DSM 21050 = YC6267 TaxID=1121015 RepID=A0A091AUP5_9GAMM|nr:peptidoglycan DD-metalloendopeptidase family protein [Arenimonas oryziterrae]KFN43988.1 hypothetical protein N789_08545 [Arenimonas oryziterrae DSM 21050 = YC6267]